MRSALDDENYRQREARTPSSLSRCERWSLEPIEVAREIVDILEDQKAEDIVLIDIQGLAIFADFFIICSGTSERMIKALLNSVVRGVKGAHHVRPNVEGQPTDGWLLADYGDVILHIFSAEQRAYYQLEELWSEARVLLKVQ